MSWLEGETDVLEKLHGALTEVGLPACRTKHMHKNVTEENKCCIIQQTGSNHISCVAGMGPVWGELSGYQRLNLIFTERVKARHAPMHGMIKRKNTILAVNLSD